MDSSRSDLTLCERQEYELQALQAIYMDDVTDLRLADGEILEPPDMRIRLRPHESVNVAEAHAGVALMVKFTRSYPEEVPLIYLDEVKGLSHLQVAQLKQELDRLAKKMIGQEMVFALCQHVQTYLHSNNKPPSKSFYDEMLLNRQRQEQRKAQANEKRLELLRLKEQKEIEQIEEEIKRKEEALKEDLKKRRELARQEEQNQARWSRSCSPSDRLKRRKSNSLSNAEQANDSEDLRLQYIENAHVMQFHGKQDIEVYKGKYLGRSSHRSTQVYLGLDLKSGEIVTVTEWSMHCAATSSGDGEMVHSPFSSANFNHQISAIECELMSLLSINHSNLVHYRGIHYVVQPTDLKITVLTEYVGGGSLLVWINNSLIVPLDVLRHYTREILSGLQYLHNNDVTHGDLRLTSLHLDSMGHIRIADYSIHKRIVDLVSSSDQKVQTHTKIISGEPPSKKNDILNLGLVLLALIRGSVTADSNCEIPQNLPPELVDFLQRCIPSTTNTNWNVHQLSEHAFVKTAVRANLVIAVPKLGTQYGAKGLGTSDEGNSGAGGEDNTEIPCIPFFSGCVSRVNNEFQVLCKIGHGAFGDVVKVRNKLDGRCYAIKRIPLNPSKKQLTKKITREVKLLSRLNHENVVRYFNSWIETTEQVCSSRSASTLSPSKSPNSRAMSVRAASSRRTSLSAVRKIAPISEKLVSASPQSNTGDNDSVNWDSPSERTDQDSETDEDSSDELEDHGVFDSFRLFGDDDSDEESVQFLREGDEEDQESNTSSTEDHDDSSPGSISTRSGRRNHKSPYRLQCLYIQMEFCEKSTLRDCIDLGLHQDVRRVWQLFREIIEGLVHIHDQGMIHRDLKPVNIFLDSNDHVKIGDFGLATTDVIAASEIGMLDINTPDASNKLDSGQDDESLTGRVGTALYVSPEMMNSTTRYNQKVDLYSLGVIFFEMCYRPMATGMERIKTLTNLRHPNIELPDDFNELEMENQVTVLRWLLNHNPSRRPTSKELLKSSYLPPPHMEESELHEVLRSTIADPESSAYKHMINTIFSQSVPLPKKDFAYDSSLYKAATSCTSDEIVDNALAHRSVVDMLEGIFRKHGAVCIGTPLLMPKSLLHETNETYVCLMDHSGGLVGLPHDSKVPFARYLARTGVTQLKRYAIENVYRENRLQGLHPRELAACSFDIVHPSACSSLIPDAEVIAIVSEIISEMEAHDCHNYKIRINHTSLVKAIFLHCGIAEALHSEVYAILGNSKMERQQKLQIRTRLCSLSLSEQSVDQLCNFIFHDGEFRKQASYLRCITKTVGEASSLAKKGLRELEDIQSYVECLGCKFQHVLALGLLANIEHYSGIIFQIVSEVKRKNGTSLDVLAAGGRYDALIAHFLKPGARSTQLLQKVVGVSIAFDKVSSAFKKPDNSQLPAVTDALIWSLGNRSMAKDQQILQIAKDLWSIGVSANIHLTTDDSLEDVKDNCRSNRIGHLIVQKDSEVSLYRVQTAEKDRVIKCCKSHVEVIDYFQSRARSSENSDTQPNVVLKSQSSSSVVSNIESFGNIYPNVGSTSSGNIGGVGNAGLPNYNINYVFPDSNKLAKNAKRQYESQILSAVAAMLPLFSNRCRIEILAVDLNMLIIKSLAAHLELSPDEGACSSSVGAVVKEYPRYKKYLLKITDEIHDLKYENNKNVAVMVLYSLSDEAYRVLL